jgi:hypothetical protein
MQWDNLKSLDLMKLCNMSPLGPGRSNLIRGGDISNQQPSYRRFPIEESLLGRAGRALLP